MQPNKGPRCLLVGNKIFASLLVYRFVPADYTAGVDYLKKLFILDLDWSLLAVYWAWTIVWEIWYMTISIVTSRGKCLN